ncbi:hypothetical protein DFH29DRAFT_956251 [Suillus ampliporus]|nr:hypothetical protein DFH29DRAFT_956243 [Suillus ampliporus]KAG0695288.1 hypothetical protein DFH29DRAFT_956251 [Suillus ampliporus]
MFARINRQSHLLQTASALLIMSNLPSGTYKICNFDSGKVLAMTGDANGVMNILGQSNTNDPKSLATQLWTVQVLDSGNNQQTVRLVNLSYGSFASIKSPGPSGSVTGGFQEYKWILVPTATVGQYQIELPDQSYICGANLNDGSLQVQVFAAGATASDNQIWMFYAA